MKSMTCRNFFIQIGLPLMLSIVPRLTPPRFAIWTIYNIAYPIDIHLPSYSFLFPKSIPCFPLNHPVARYGLAQAYSIMFTN